MKNKHDRILNIETAVEDHNKFIELHEGNSDGNHND